MADSSLDDYIQQKGIGLRRKLVANRGNNTSGPIKRQNVSGSSDHIFQAKKPYDAREKLQASLEAKVGNQKEDARLKLMNKKLDINGRLGAAPTHIVDARSRLLAKQKKPSLALELPARESCEVLLENNDSYQLSSIKKTLRKGAETQMNLGGWSLVKTVTNDTAAALTGTKSQTFPPQVQTISKIVMNAGSRKVAQPNTESVKTVEKVASLADKEPTQAFVSPIQSYRVVVGNLGPNVTYEDVEELFTSCGPLRKVKMSKPGSAEIYFINVESAHEAVEEYHNRELDDRPMSVVVSLLQDTNKQNDAKPLRSKKQLSALKQSLEVDPNIISQALFRACMDQTSNSVEFTVHL